MLETATSGVLALAGGSGYPYAVPLSFAYEGGRLYFHSATAGQKLDAIAANDKASFCVIADDDVVPSALTTRYRSAVVFGHIRVVAEDTTKRHALQLLARKYSPDYPDEAEAEIDRDWERVCVLELTVEHMSGKAGIEVIRQRWQTTGQAE